MSDVIGPTIRSWMALSVELLGQQREEIDRLNVFPVPDGDTGTNLYLTLEAAADALNEVEGTSAVLAEAMAHGALLGARGNSGVITSQILRGFADAIIDAPGHSAEQVFVDGLSRAAESAYRAVAVPREGTILSVIRAAAEGATTVAQERLRQIAQEAQDAAEEALARTPEQLQVLRDAGVVDAGGRGLVVMLDALRRAVTGERAPLTSRRPVVTLTAHAPVAGYDGPEYEVMYLLDADDEAAVSQLRESLDELGDSVVVVGGRGLWNIHVHTDDVGAAIERGVETGRPHRIRVTRLLEADSLRERGRGTADGRGIVVVAHGEQLAEFLEESGATVVRAPARGRPSTGELLDGIKRAHANEVIILPSDRDTTPVAEAAAAAARDSGVRASVVPTRAVVQSLAALAVHDPAARLEDDLVAMGRAAGATHYGGVTVAARHGNTMVGVCEVGDILGLADGDIVAIGSDVGDVAVGLAERVVAGGAELLTIVTGVEAVAAITDRIAAEVTRDRPYLEVEVLPGGQAYWPYIFGAE